MHLVFLWLANPELAIARVAFGGHAMSDDVVRRRYGAGLRNFFGLYQPLASTWRVYDNSDVPEPRLIARGEESRTLVLDVSSWTEIVRQFATPHG